MSNLDGVFRREWGPAVAALARWSGDLNVAEHAVQEAFTEALRAWPRDGVPDNPGAWVRRMPAAAPAIACVANPRARTRSCSRWATPLRPYTARSVARMPGSSRWKPSAVSSGQTLPPARDPGGCPESRGPAAGQIVAHTT